MMKISSLKDWFEVHGRVHKIVSDPKGEYWVSAYLEDVHKLIEAEIKKAERRSARKGGMK